MKVDLAELTASLKREALREFEPSVVDLMMPLLSAVARALVETLAKDKS